MNNLIYIASGGAVGSLLRYWMSNSVQTLFDKDFPYGTLSVNLLGSLLIGLLSVILEDRLETNVALRLMLIVGFLGGFTTFSAFSLETFTLIQVGQPGKACLNALLNVSLCLTGCWLGIMLGKKI